MGGGSSLPLPSLPTNEFMCIALTVSDRITLLYAGQQEIEVCRMAILTHWVGIQSEKLKLQIENSELACYQFKLHGFPFQANSATSTSIKVRKLATKLLHDMYNIGWKLNVSSDLSRYSDLTTWVFQRHNLPPENLPMFCIGLSSYDKLQINDCPPHVLKLIRELLVKQWQRGIQKDEETDTGTHTFKLSGTPWQFVNKNESCSARYLIRELIQLLAVNQYTLYGNSNLKSTTDTIFFQYNPRQEFDQQFISLSLNRCDRLRFIQLSDSVIATLEDAVRMTWGKGVQEVIDERPFCFEMKLKGNPWWASGSEAIESRKLMVVLFERLASIGYFPITGIDMTRKMNDKSYFILKRGAPLRTDFFCLSLNETDLIRLIKAPSNVVQVTQQMTSHWPLGLQQEKKLYDGVTFQTKLRGNPWSTMYRNEGFQGRALLLALLSSFTRLGWRLVCSADVSAKYIHQDNGPDYPLDVHSWFFMYDESLLVQAGSVPPPPISNFYPTAPQMGFNDPPPDYNTAMSQ